MYIYVYNIYTCPLGSKRMYVTNGCTSTSANICSRECGSATLIEPLTLYILSPLTLTFRILSSPHRRRPHARFGRGAALLCQSCLRPCLLRLIWNNDEMVTPSVHYNEISKGSCTKMLSSHGHELLCSFQPKSLNPMLALRAHTRDYASPAL